jgi:hypothetical protein
MVRAKTSLGGFVWSLTKILIRRLFHRCSQFAQRFSVLLRALGLGILTVLRGNEPPQVLINSSRRLALARCAVHILPASVSICLLALNLYGYFIGRELQGYQDQDDVKLGFLQIAAKTQVGLF